MKKSLKKLVLSRETVRTLDGAKLKGAAGGDTTRFTAETCDLNNEVCANHDDPSIGSLCISIGC